MKQEVATICYAISIFLIITAAGTIHAMDMPMDVSEETPTEIPASTPTMGIPDPSTSKGSTPTPTAFSESDVKSEQFGWPDTSEFAENKPSPAVGGPGVLLIYKESEKKLADIATIINALNKMRQTIYQKFFDLDTTLDAFFQKTSADRGNLEETFSKQGLK